MTVQQSEVGRCAQCLSLLAALEILVGYVL